MMHAMKAAVPVSASATEMTELVLPQHANAIGTAFGGTITAWIDICAAIVAHRHTGHIAVTAAIDELTFVSPIRVGDIVCLHGRVNAVFRTSLEIEVKVEVEEPRTRARRLCVESFLTFVSTLSDGTPAAVPPLQCETDDDRQREQEAKSRREDRLRRRALRKTP